MPKILLGIAATFAFAFALSLPLATDAQAHKYRYKMCTAKPHFHSAMSWKCKASQKCCYNWLLRRGTCVAASSRCL